MFRNAIFCASGFASQKSTLCLKKPQVDVGREMGVVRTENSEPVNDHVKDEKLLRTSSHPNNYFHDRGARVQLVTVIN